MSSYQSITIPRRRRLSQAASPNQINSLGHFAQSFQRAQSFLNIETPREVSRARSFFRDDASTSHQHSFAARYLSEHADAVSDISEDGDATTDHYDDEDDYNERASLISDSPFGSSPGRHNFRQRALSYAAKPNHGQTVLDEAEAVGAHDSEPVLIRTVEDADGKVLTVVAGQSTAPQTVFNSVNVLIGVGLLTLPLGFKYAGWLIGGIMLIFSALATSYTAWLLSKCMETDPTIVTYADISYVAFGPRARLMVSALFSLELLGSGVSLVVLFADSLHALMPSISALTFKLISFAILTPPCFLPLRILSISSMLGIMATFGLVLIVLFDGLYKGEAPGSLWSPAKTWIMPQNWYAVPLAIGIFMAPWGGHAVFPNIYRDMRHPHKYKQCLVTIYEITFLTDAAMGVLGFLMFGNMVEDEVTKNILTTPGYPHSISIIVTCLIAVVPLSKTPLNARPIVSTLDILLGLDKYPLEIPHGKDFFAILAKVLIRVGVVFAFVALGILFPDFDKIIALTGSTLTLLICLILPIIFYLKIYADRVSMWETVICIFLLIIFSILAVLGTVWVLLPDPYPF